MAVVVGGVATVSAACRQTTEVGGATTDARGPGEPAADDGVDPVTVAPDEGGVVMIGDSLTEGAMSALASAFASGDIGVQRINGALTAIVGERPFAIVADWAEEAPTDGLLIDDGIHSTDAGNAAFASLVVAAVYQLR